MVADLGKLLLRWVVPALDTVSVAEPGGRRLYAAVATLAGRAAWAAFDTGGHESARTLLRLALYTAVRSGDHDLRAHLLADAAAQHTHVGYHRDALDLVRLVEGDERLNPAVRLILHGVKARAYAALGEADSCRGQVALAESAHTSAQGHHHGDRWVGRIAHPGQVHAATGHAIARLARHTGRPGDWDEASRRLGEAVECLDAGSHARARALCLCRLAVLQLASDDLDQAVHHGRQGIAAASLIRSARLHRALGAVRTAARERRDAPAVRELIADIDTATGGEVTG